jgi:hypothetical protein
MFDTRIEVYARNKFMYYIILFAGFVVSILIMPWVKTQVVNILTKYTQLSFVHDAVTYLVVYLAAIYLLPEIGFMAFKQFSKE